MSSLFNKVFDIDTNANNKYELQQLYKQPPKESGDNMPRFQPQNPNMLHQADLLFLPNDKGYKYALVVVDVGSRLVDAVPLKTKQGSEVLDGFKKIYSDGYLKYPHRLEVDAGAEFKGIVKQYMKNKNVYVRTAKPERHRQQAIVERQNETIGHVLHQRMTAQELLTGEPSVSWVKYLPRVIKAMNEEAKKRKPKPMAEDPIGHGISNKILPIGTKVRVMLDSPKDVAYEEKLFGNFRKSDIRWDQTIRTIKEILIKPRFPIMYLLNGNVGKRHTEPISYTRQQLQVIHKNEIPPDGAKVISGKPKKFVVEKLLDRKKINGKIHFLVKWRGWKDPTWEKRKELIKTIPQLIEEFEDDI